MGAQESSFSESSFSESRFAAPPQKKKSMWFESAGAVTNSSESLAELDIHTFGNARLGNSKLPQNVHAFFLSEMFNMWQYHQKTTACLDLQQDLAF